MQKSSSSLPPRSSPRAFSCFPSRASIPTAWQTPAATSATISANTSWDPASRAAPRTSWASRPPSMTDGPAASISHASAISPRSIPNSSAATDSKAAAAAPCFGAAFKEEVRKKQCAFIGMGAFGEVLARYENYVDLDPVVKDKWGIPALRFHYKFGDNEHRMAEDMKETAQEMFEAAGFEIVRVNSRVLTEGWSIHELGTARMGSDPKTSVLNQFQQSHDVKNLFVVDGSAFVNASCQNPTWTIMSLCWRSCDYLADEMKKGNL